MVLSDDLYPMRPKTRTRRSTPGGPKGPKNGHFLTPYEHKILVEGPWKPTPEVSGTQAAKRREKQNRRYRKVARRVEEILPVDEDHRGQRLLDHARKWTLGQRAVVAHVDDDALARSIAR